jgi:hypothetical protein
VPFEIIRKELDVAFEKAYQDSGVLLRYARSDRQPHANSHTFYLNYEGPLGSPSGKEVKTDITIKEKMVFPIEDLSVLQAYAEYEDIPGNAIIKVYSLKKSRPRKSLRSATGQGTNPATSTIYGIYASKPMWTWPKLSTPSLASLSSAAKPLKQFAGGWRPRRRGSKDCGAGGWQGRWQHCRNLIAFSVLSGELSGRPASARPKFSIFITGRGVNQSDLGRDADRTSKPRSA